MANPKNNRNYAIVTDYQISRIIDGLDINSFDGFDGFDGPHCHLTDQIMIIRD